MHIFLILTSSSFILLFNIKLKIFSPSDATGLDQMLMNMLRVPADKPNMPDTDEPMTPPMSPIVPLIRMIMNMLRVPADEPSMPTCPACCSQGDCNPYLKQLCDDRDCLSRKLNVNPFPSCCLSDSCAFFGDQIKCPSYLSNYCFAKLRCCAEGSCRTKELEEKCFEYKCDQPECPQCCHWQNRNCFTGHNQLKCSRCLDKEPPCPRCCSNRPFPSCGGFFENLSLCGSCDHPPNLIFNLLGK